MTTSSGYRYVFGPVPSRRLGRSLGVDLVPLKRCPFDCVYCQLGRTFETCLERSEFVPMADVLDEIRRKLAEGAAPDYITMSGSGEPTLYARLGQLIRAVKAECDVPVAVLTNGALFGDPEVREAVAGADLVVPSLDAAGEAQFQRINRPHRDLTLTGLIDGLMRFRAEFDGAIWLEVFLLDDASDEEIDALAATAQRIDPDRIQLNTVARPPAEKWARALEQERMQAICARFGPKAEIIASYAARGADSQGGTTEEDVLATLRRRPCSAADIAAGLNIHPIEAGKILSHLEEGGAVRQEERGETVYYVAVDA